ncbi:MAG: hypothetical protein K2Q01_06145 [Rickettsiales bacterium]|nr:hypothetical protein [Rickettsiales bacterium]
MKGEVERVLRMNSLATRKSFKLDDLVFKNTNSIHLFGECEVRVTDHMDLVHLDKNGKVIYDSKAQRAKEEKEKFNLLTNYIIDPILNKLTASYHTALNDSNNCLIHLYEIRDTLSQHFGGEAIARTELCITQATWKTLGKLANNEPLKEGRHRGEHLNLRSANTEEIATAFMAAEEMVMKYTEYLDTQHNNCNKT